AGGALEFYGLSLALVWVRDADQREAPPVARRTRREGRDRLSPLLRQREPQALDLVERDVRAAQVGQRAHDDLKRRHQIEERYRVARERGRVERLDGGEPEEHEADDDED